MADRQEFPVRDAGGRVAVLQTLGTSDLIVFTARLGSRSGFGSFRRLRLTSLRQGAPGMAKRARNQGGEPCSG